MKLKPKTARRQFLGFLYATLLVPNYWGLGTRQDLLNPTDQKGQCFSQVTSMNVKKKKKERNTPVLFWALEQKRYA